MTPTSQKGHLGSGGRPGLPGTAPALVPRGKPLYRPLPWKHIQLPTCLGPGDPAPQRSAEHGPPPLLNIDHAPSRHAAPQPAAGPSHRPGAVLPAPHLQPSSSSSWPLPHVWFPLATRQTLGVTLPAVAGHPSALPPPQLQPQEPGGTLSSTHPPWLRGRPRQRGAGGGVRALVAPGLAGAQGGSGHVA